MEYTVFFELQDQFSTVEVKFSPQVLFIVYVLTNFFSPITFKKDNKGCEYIN